MKHVLALTIALTVTAPAAAESAYTAADAEHQQNCFEAVTDINLDQDDPATPGYRECIGVASSACQDAPDGQTTMGMATCTMRETAWWDEMLNHNYTSLQNALDTDTFDALRTAQRAWMDFRDAECGFQYTYWQEGTIRSLYATTCQLQMTAERALALQAVIDWSSL